MNATGSAMGVELQEIFSGATSLVPYSRYLLLRAEKEGVPRQRYVFDAGQYLKIGYLWERVYVSPKFEESFKLLIPLCVQVVAMIDAYLSSANAVIERYVFDVYDAGEGGVRELVPYIEVQVKVKEVDRMLQLWRGTIEYIQSTLGDEVLDYLDVFFTRA